MKRKFSTEAKVGVFVLVTIVILAYLTIGVSQLGFTPGGTYHIYTVMENAEGVSLKTPVQVAGIPVGTVSRVELTPDQKAKVEIELKRSVHLGDDVIAEVRTRGVLGDTYIEIFPGANPQANEMQAGGTISRTKQPVDYQELVRDLADLTKDMKEITTALKTYTVSEKSYSAEILKNMQVITANLANFSTNNTANMNAIVSNMRALTQDLRTFSQASSGDVEVALKRISEITDKIDSGTGSVGKLMNDPSTVEKTNEVLDNISGLTSGLSRIETELSYHMEYLGTTKDVKNYVGLKFQTRPDKFFLFEVVHDPNPPGTNNNTEVTTVTTAGGATSTVTTETQNFKKVRFSAELGKKFWDFTLRGGLIESTGGVGVDYSKGPVTVQFSAFDFSNRAHLKFLTQLNLTRALFLVGGVDDFISKEHDPDWFLGAGIRFTDEDVKSLLGIGAAVAR